VDAIPNASSNASPAVTTGEHENIRILHLTDLHYGKGFNADLWDDVKRNAVTLKPHLILVTGDLVNNPYWWTFRAAQVRLDSLRNAASDGDQQPKLFVIPGNHDTRLSGLLPISWIAPVVFFCCLTVSVGGYLHHWPQAWHWAVPISAILLGCRAISLRKFSRYFGAYIPQLPTTMKDMNLVLYPFDSATSPIAWACGNVPFSQFLAARGDPDQTRLPPYKMAIVHHHSVPIPYDSKSEAMMVLKNAGAFLSEIAALRVRLVLSGHKHHQHVSRVKINAETEHELEFTVLNTGSATASKSPGAHGHNFSFIEIHPQRGAQITQYQSIGAPFSRLKSFWVDSIDKSARALLRENEHLKKFRYDSLEIDVAINPDGDAFRKMTVRGFRYFGATPIDRLPVRWGASVDTGQIERPVIRPDPGAPVETRLADVERERQRIEGTIKFTEMIKLGRKPFGFSVERHEINAYAMSAQQFGLLHPKQNTELPIEFVEIDQQRAPVGELVLRVRLPEKFKVKHEPSLVILRGDSVEQDMQDEYTDTKYFSFDAPSNTATARIPFAPLGLKYRIEWELVDEPPPAGRPFSLSREGEVAEVVNRFVDLKRDDPRIGTLSAGLLEGIADVARKMFKLDASAEDPLFLDIMVFDQKTKKLRVVVANYPAGDSRWDAELSYGDGIAGRAYKMNTVRLFVKKKAIIDGTPFYYVEGTGKPPTDNGDEIKEQALISLPLSHPEQPETVFGVLNISSRRESSRLVDLTSDQITSDFLYVVNEACFEVMKQLT
jgi:3',5'-cyclic AMP phosphodiesterase CpdA